MMKIQQLTPNVEVKSSRAKRKNDHPIHIHQVPSNHYKMMISINLNLPKKVFFFRKEGAPSAHLYIIILPNSSMNDVIMFSCHMFRETSKLNPPRQKVSGASAIPLISHVWHVLPSGYVKIAIENGH